MPGSRQLPQFLWKSRSWNPLSEEFAVRRRTAWQFPAADVDIVAEKSVTAPIEDGATADATRRTYEDDRDESGLLDM